MNENTELIEAGNIKELRKDFKKAIAEMNDSMVRYLVDAYYREQKERISSGNMVTIAKKEGEPTAIMEFVTSQHMANEKNIQKLLSDYTNVKPLGQWLRSICGVGPVLAAGIMAHIDITKAQTAGAIWRFAGLDPTLEWNKGQKRPFNAKLKTLAWKLGQSFIKTQNRETDVYGHIYAERKRLEEARNEAGEFAEQAAEQLKKKNYGKDTEAYKAYIKGKLPPAHISQRAARYAVKIFLSHFFEVAYEMHYGKRAPIVYAIAILQHAHEIPIPNWVHVDEAA